MSDLATPVFRNANIELPASPLVLCDRLIALAKQADSAGYAVIAGQLVRLAHSMFDDEAPATRRHRRLC